MKKFCESKKILFIEDNAIYLGNYSDKEGQKEYAGSFGDVSLLSFGIMKNYNSLFGGACLTSLNDLSEFIEIREKSLKNFDIMDYINKLTLCPRECSTNNDCINGICVGNTNKYCNYIMETLCFGKPTESINYLDGYIGEIKLSTIASNNLCNFEIVCYKFFNNYWLLFYTKQIIILY